MFPDKEVSGFKILESRLTRFHCTVVCQYNVVQPMSLAVLEVSMPPLPNILEITFVDLPFSDWHNQSNSLLHLRLLSLDMLNLNKLRALLNSATSYLTGRGYWGTASLSQQPYHASLQFHGHPNPLMFLVNRHTYFYFLFLWLFKHTVIIQQ